MTTLWDEFDSMAYNLRGQAHSGVPEEVGRALLDVATLIEGVLERYAGTAEGRSSELEESVDRLVDMYDSSPATMEHLSKRYSGLHHAIESLMMARTRTKGKPVPVLPQCDHWADEERGVGRCIHPAGHEFPELHQDANGNRWSW
jgi:hypothetical protein